MATPTSYAQPDYQDSITIGNDKNPTQAFVRADSAAQVTTSTIAKAYGANNTAGNLLFCTFWNSSSGTVGTTTVADSNVSWTALPAIVITGTAVVMQSFYTTNCKGGANTVTATVTGGSGTQTKNMVIGEWYGANTIDQHKEGTASSTTSPASGAVTTGHKEICIGYASLDGTVRTWDNTSDATYTVRSANTNVVSFSSKENIAAGSISFTDHQTGAAGNSAAGVVTFYMVGPNTQGLLATTESSGVITVGAHRILHICASVSPVSSSRCALSYTLGNSTGTVAPTPGASSPFFLGDEGWSIDTGFYDQINLANLSALNGGVTLAYSVSVLSKF